MALTIAQARQLKPGDVLIDREGKRWKVNGQVKTWKLPQNAHRIRIPLKHGLYRYDALNEWDFPNGICTLIDRKE